MSGSPLVTEPPEAAGSRIDGLWAHPVPWRWRSTPGGCGHVLVVEESPDSAGQDAGESQAGATSRRGNREQTADAARAAGKGATVG
jgi:hypothetical protein